MNRALSLLLVVLLPAVAVAGELSPLLRHPPVLPGASAFAAADGRVAIRLAGPVDDGALAALRRAGAEPDRLPSGGLVVVGSVVSATVPRHRLEAVAALPGVVSVEPVRPLQTLPPLHRTAAQVEATRLWYPPADELGERRFGNLGEGVIVADHETACDPFHPDLFQPDAGRYDFHDQDHDGVAGEGDLVDLDGDGVFESELSLLEAVHANQYTGGGNEMAGYQPDVDWLYVDENGDGTRNFGAREGFSDAVPAFGEPIFAADDADGSTAIEPGEKLLRLGTAKVRAVSIDRPGHLRHVYRRGHDLSRFPYQEFEDANRGHGTSALGVIAGGWPGVRRYTGLAPAAELLLIGHDSIVSSVAASIELGAHVNFYEESAIVANHDGASADEVAISEGAAAGPVHVAATGNLAGTAHVMELAPLGPALETARFKIDRRYRYRYRVAWAVLGWPGAPGDVAWALVGADGSRFEPGPEEYAEGVLAGLAVTSWRTHNDRGTSYIVAFTNGGQDLPEEVISLEVRATGAELPRFRGLVSDDQSSWAKGAHWLDHVSENGTAIKPSTADRVIAVGAHGGIHSVPGWGVVGERRSFSGMGPRIDGAPVTDLSSPDDPYVPQSESTMPHGAYRAFSGTSGALPHVAAAAALILAERPALDHDAVERLLRDGALRDEFTGPVPNEAYGHGKVRVARALGKAPRPEGDAPRLSISVGAAAAGRPVEVTVLAEAEGAVRVAFDVGNDGVEERAAAVDPTFRFVPEGVGHAVIAARAIDAEGRQARAVRLFEVREDCATAGCPDGLFCGRTGLCGTEPDDGGEDGGGSDGGEAGGCATAAGGRTAAWPLALLAALLARRRRG